MEKRKLFNMYVNTAPYEEFKNTILHKANSGESHYACIANVHMLMEAHKRSSFADIVNGATITTPDGQPLTWAFKLLHGIKQDRVAGMDLLPHLLQEAESKQMPVFFYGGSEEMLKKTSLYLKANYPALPVAGLYSPPFRALTSSEETDVANHINQSGAKLVFVILGCPKQEAWMASMKGRINAFMVGVGGALPVLIGMQRRAPKWMQSAGLEWCYRLSQEPGRLFKRYAVTNSMFLFLFFKAYLRKKLSPNTVQTSAN